MKLDRSPEKDFKGGNKAFDRGLKEVEGVGFMIDMHDLMEDIAIERLRDMHDKIELTLKNKVGHLSVDDIKRRCKCTIFKNIHTYYLDNVPIIEVDFNVKYDGMLI